MKNIHSVSARLPVVFGCLLAAVLGCVAQGVSARAQDRITGPIDADHASVLKQTPHAMVTAANDLGALDPTKFIGGVRIALKQTAAQASDLAQFLEDQRNPASSDYQRWLTPEEYGARFGVSQNDLDRITSWLLAQGFAIRQVARAKNWIAFGGTAGQLGRTFRTELHRYRAGGETHFANATAPWIPEALADIVSDVHGLDDFHPKPQVGAKKLRPNMTTSAGVHYLAPDDLAAIYDIAPLYSAGIDGTGQKLVIAGQTDINLADIRGFRAQFGLAAKDPQLVLDGPDPGVSASDQIEADLDLEWSGAVARNATIIYVYSQDVFESLQYAIDENLAPVVSMSYGECETGAPASYRSMAQQANAEGITWMNSSGDGGAGGCDYDVGVAVKGLAVGFPADIPEVTAVGGTELSESGSAGWSGQNSLTGQSAAGYIPEIAWNDTTLGGGIWASGGGASALFGKPSWQVGPGVPNDNARDVPDVALTASGDHDAYLIYAAGGLMTVGGTSASAPSFAGIVSLIDQYVVAKGIQGKAGLGNINPNLYALAQSTTGIMHDVTSGSNIVPCETGTTGCTTGSFGYTAGVGYDLVTGLGSVDAYNLVTKWAAQPVTIGTTLSLTASPTGISQSATLLLTAKITAVSGSAGPAGSVAFTAGGMALGSAAATVSGATATATLSVKGSSLEVGSEAITASYAPTGGFSISSGSTTVTVTGLPVATKTTVAANPISIAANGTAQLTATVTPASGTVQPTGIVTFSRGGAALGTATLAAATATLGVSGAMLAAGANSITASYAGSANFTASASPAITLTMAASLITTTVSMVANPVNIVQSASTVVTVTVKSAGGTVAPTGSVSFTAGNASLGTAALTASGLSALAALTVNGVNLIAGNNIVTGTYSGDSRYSVSTGSVTVTVTVAAPAIATTTIAAASPATIAQNGSTQLTAMVMPASGATLPSGSVNFAIGATVLGSASMTVSGGMAYAVLSVAGGKLTLGHNNIVASYSGGAGFTASTGTVLVIVNAPAVATASTLTANQAGGARTASTQLTISVKAATGTATPTGIVTFTDGAIALGTATLTGSGATATAMLTVNAGSLAAGTNTIIATYPGSAAFGGSSGSATVTTATRVIPRAIVKGAKNANRPAGLPI